MMAQIGKRLQQIFDEIGPDIGRICSPDQFSITPPSEMCFHTRLRDAVALNESLKSGPTPEIKLENHVMVPPFAIGPEWTLLFFAHICEIQERLLNADYIRLLYDVDISETCQIMRLLALSPCGFAPPISDIYQANAIDAALVRIIGSFKSHLNGSDEASNHSEWAFFEHDLSKSAPLPESLLRSVELPQTCER